jgi:hypothetical protein
MQTRTRVNGQAGVLNDRTLFSILVAFQVSLALGIRVSTHSATMSFLSFYLSFCLQIGSRPIVLCAQLQRQMVHSLFAQLELRSIGPAEGLTKFRRIGLNTADIHHTNSTHLAHIFSAQS